MSQVFNAALRHPKLWLGFGLFWVLAIVVSCLMPAPLTEGGVGFDKVLHCGAFAGLALWFGAVYQRRRYVRVALALAALGGAIELAQALTGYRSAELLDFLADCAGIALGIALAHTPLGQSLRYIEARVVPTNTH